MLKFIFGNCRSVDTNLRLNRTEWKFENMKIKRKETIHEGRVDQNSIMDNN